MTLSLFSMARSLLSSYSKLATRSVGYQVIGIDLGATNSRVCVMNGKDPRVVVHDGKARSTPSLVAFDPKGELLVGELAKRQRLSDPSRAIFSPKWLIGRSYLDALTQKEMDTIKYEVAKGPRGDAWVFDKDQRHSPSEIEAYVITKLKEASEAYIGKRVRKAVITVPASFDESQRDATKDAALLAGLEVHSIIQEPIAAAASYALNKNKGFVVVFDLGGRTLDISILEIVDGSFEVKATITDPLLGGGDFDDKVVEFIVSEFKNRKMIDISKDELALEKIREASKKAKRILSTADKTNVYIPCIKDGTSLFVKISRSQFEISVKDLIERVKICCEVCMKKAALTTEDIDEVFLVGGMAHMPKIIEVVTEQFGRSPLKDSKPDEAIVKGAAILGSTFRGKDIKEADILSFGLEKLGGVFTRVFMLRPLIYNLYVRAYFWSSTKTAQFLMVVIAIGTIVFALLKWVFKLTRKFDPFGRKVKNLDAPTSSEDDKGLGLDITGLEKRLEKIEVSMVKQEAKLDRIEESMGSGFGWKTGVGLYSLGLVMGGLAVFFRP